jgi:hypothetical protein
MASEYYLYSSKTNEAVEVLRHGANGQNTPQGSPKAQFGFLSYHFGKNATYRLTELDSIAQIGEEVQFVRSLEELKQEQEFHSDMVGKVTLILLWQENSVEQLLGREPEQLIAINGYEFNYPVLTN